MPSCDTYHLTWVSVTLDVGVSLHGCSSKAQPLLLTLDEGYLHFDIFSLNYQKVTFFRVSFFLTVV